MKPILAFTTGVSVYFVWLFFWSLSEFGFAKAKGLLGCAAGAALFGSYAVRDFRRMMRAFDEKHVQETSWVGENVRVGCRIATAKVRLSDRYTLKAETSGFSCSAGRTTVLDFQNVQTEVRLVARRGRIFSVRVKPQ